jgi:LacI family transcriptional regulator
MVTLVDIARQTNTSVSTVSRVLSGGAMSSRISKETRQRVKEVAEQLGYRPNLVARSLRTRKTYTIALLVSDVANPFFGQIGSLIERSLAVHGYSLMLCNTAEDIEKEAAYLRVIAAKGIDGLIVVPLADSKEVITKYLPKSLPLVILDRPIAGISSTVASDQDQIASILCDKLQTSSVKQIALLCGPQHIITHRRRCEILHQRFKVIVEHEGPAQKATGRQAFLKFAPFLSQVQAIVCTNNFLAQGVVESLGEIEKPPIVGVFDEIPMMQLLRVPIVCSMQDIPALAEGCVTQIMKLLGKVEQPIEPILLHASTVTNRAFQIVQFGATGKSAAK